MPYKILKMVNLGMVVAQFNHEITNKMSKSAKQRAKELNVKIIKIIKVPGSFEIPLAVKRLLDYKNIDGVITIGTIIKGDTDHDQVVAAAVAKKILDLSVEYNKPVSLGISGPNITWEQSEKRVDDYSLRAVDSVVKMLDRNLTSNWIY